MAEADREAWITGIGIVSCLGEGPQAHWQKLVEAHPSADTTTFAPYVVHPLAPVNFDSQIPKKGDQRQMEAWQRIGTYAAGLALDSAGVKGKTDILSHMDMIVAAGGGERDLAVDTAILSGLPHAKNPAAFLNERLMSDLRPTLFLAQLSNLLAGNISIVHGVTGSSRTFMGEESCGVEAVRVAHARIAAGQSTLALVGAAYNAERWEVMLHFALGRRLARLSASLAEPSCSRPRRSPSLVTAASSASNSVSARLLSARQVLGQDIPRPRREVVRFGLALSNRRRLGRLRCWQLRKQVWRCLCRHRRAPMMLIMPAAFHCGNGQSSSCS